MSTQTLTTDDLNQPGGVPQINTLGEITTPVGGPVDDGTVGAYPLRLIIPGLAAIGRITEGYIPSRMLGQPYGPAELNANSQLTNALTATAMTTTWVQWMLSLPTTDPQVINIPWNNAGVPCLSLGPDTI